MSNEKSYSPMSGYVMLTVVLLLAGLALSGCGREPAASGVATSPARIRLLSGQQYQQSLADI